jgi:hypothetical protein
MIKNWGKYRIIFFILIVIGLFVYRTFFQKKTTPKIPPVTIGINRNPGNLIFTRHAECRMKCRDITEDEVKEILLKGNINYMKSDLKNERGPTYALEGYSDEQQHLRIIFAPKKDEVVVVSCIDLDKEWHCDCN